MNKLICKIKCLSYLLWSTLLWLHHSPINHSHTDGGRAAVQGIDLPIWSHLGFSVLDKKTSLESHFSQQSIQNAYHLSSYETTITTAHNLSRYNIFSPVPCAYNTVNIITVDGHIVAVYSLKHTLNFSLWPTCSGFLKRKDKILSYIDVCCCLVAVSF